MTSASRDQRRELLARHINILVAQGRRVEYESEYDAVLARGHVLHLRERVSVDPFSHVTVERLPIDRERVFLAVAAVIVVLLVIVILALTS